MSSHKLVKKSRAHKSPKRKSPKPCKEGQVRGSSGRCRKARSPKKSRARKSPKKRERKPCKEHQVRGSSGRCRNKHTSKSHKKSRVRKSPKNLIVIVRKPRVRKPPVEIDSDDEVDTDDDDDHF